MEDVNGYNKFFSGNFYGFLLNYCVLKMCASAGKQEIMTNMILQGLTDRAEHQNGDCSIPIILITTYFYRYTSKKFTLKKTDTRCAHKMICRN